MFKRKKRVRIRLEPSGLWVVEVWQGFSLGWWYECSADTQEEANRRAAAIKENVEHPEEYNI